MTAVKSTPGRRLQAGLSLLELLIALTIGVFLLAGIAGVLAITRQNFDAQARMGQLQDDQRIAIDMLVSAVEHAGYYYNPQNDTALTSFPLAAPFVDEGLSVAGGSGPSAGADSISIRYVQSPAGTSSSDFMQDCNGTSNTGTAAVLSVSTFTVDSQKPADLCGRRQPGQGAGGGHFVFQGALRCGR